MPFTHLGCANQQVDGPGWDDLKGEREVPDLCIFDTPQCCGEIGVFVDIDCTEPVSVAEDWNFSI